jgi:hypothetical protein
MCLGRRKEIEGGTGSRNAEVGNKRR